MLTWPRGDKRAPRCGCNVRAWLIIGLGLDGLDRWWQQDCSKTLVRRSGTTRVLSYNIASLLVVAMIPRDNSLALAASTNCRSGDVGDIASRRGRHCVPLTKISCLACQTVTHLVTPSIFHNPSSPIHVFELF